MRQLYTIYDIEFAYFCAEPKTSDNDGATLNMILQ